MISKIFYPLILVCVAVALLLSAGSVAAKEGGKIVHAWAFEGDYDESQPIQSNTFTMEWPPRSGRQQSFPEVDKAVRIFARTYIVKIGEKNFTERIHLVDRNFFEMFDFPIITGESNSIFPNPNTKLISEYEAFRILIMGISPMEAFGILLIVTGYIDFPIMLAHPVTKHNARTTQTNLDIFPTCLPPLS